MKILKRYLELPAGQERLLSEKELKKDTVKKIYEALEVLGLPPLVSLKDIKQRYHLLAKKYHPDVGGDEEEMERINRAYKLLKEYIENYKFSFSEDEILKQFPTQNYANRFRF